MDQHKHIKIQAHKTFPCIINNEVTDGNENLLLMMANIYIDDILVAAAF